MPFRILSLDGGGIRGAFGAAFLAEIEERCECPLAEYFDLIAGTSTGSIIALAIASGLKASEVVTLYEEHGHDIFHPRPRFVPQNWTKMVYPLVRFIFQRRTGSDIDDFFRSLYCPQALEYAFESTFGDLRMQDLRDSRVIVPSVNLSRGKVHVFRTPHLPGVGDAADLRLVDILLAATAAPTYFPHKMMPDGDAYCDGGVWANNPAVIAVAEAVKIRDYYRCPEDTAPVDLSDVHVLSIGTGDLRYELTPPGSDAGSLFWARHIADVMGTSQVQGSQLPLDFILGNRYVTINFPLEDPSWTLDAVDQIDNFLQLGREKANRLSEFVCDQFLDRPTDRFVPCSEAEHRTAPVSAASRQ
ncbi:CBASS cGAMP-activated phospholipase [Stratiformator vulcanicus]|uniref:Patatin-like phospholipase n=1 Tax=Stratiformator vulcanicus TaxID=2527980 RepID=A0A517R3R9_9PLAN|nr:CBASS cGAMP-activated phospholipase [Stratiformator vulcanicus]QDT38549.1 Patatin-like phospholipase [Stratiformator vulcanicus]